LCTSVPRLQNTVEVFGQDGVAGELDNGCEPSRSPLGLPLFSDVPEYQDNAGQRSIGTEDGRATVVNRDLLSVLADQNRVICQSNNSVQAAHLIYRVLDRLACIFINDPKDFGERPASRRF